MRNMNERPICHRAEDLVTYLYGEASEVDSRDFADHLQQCDACRGELGAFQQVHNSILIWRNEALGSAFSPASVSPESAVDSAPFVQHKTKLSALEALREFFSVSPLWLRTATGFAALFLCVLGVLTISRSWNRPAPMANSGSDPKVYTRSQFDEAVAKEVAVQTAKNNTAETSQRRVKETAVESPKQAMNRNQLAAFRPPVKSHIKGLTRQEREQLLADLRLIPGRDEEELPLGLPDEPNQ